MIAVPAYRPYPMQLERSLPRLQTIAASAQPLVASNTFPPSFMQQHPCRSAWGGYAVREAGGAARRARSEPLTAVPGHVPARHAFGRAFDLIQCMFMRRRLMRDP